MTELQIKELVDQLNDNKPNKLIYLAKLSENVDLGLAWITEMNLPQDERVSGPYTFYFIKNADKLYIGAVLVMGNQDLHWYVALEYRGKKYLSTALRTIILPHLLQERDEQRISIDRNTIGEINFNASEQLALAVGFQRVSVNKGKAEYILKDHQYEDIDYLDIEYKGLSEQRLDELKSQIKTLSNSFAIIQSEVQMSMGNSMIIKELEEIIDKVSIYKMILEDTYYDWKEMNK